ncbi:hypothetical protein LP419_27335 [Massilia sp. H-1]|nr:hypothetical protein LP419_27335 [Massilia sp. H-1]
MVTISALPLAGSAIISQLMATTASSATRVEVRRRRSRTSLSASALTMSAIMRTAPAARSAAPSALLPGSARPAGRPAHGDSGWVMRSAMRSPWRCEWSTWTLARTVSNMAASILADHTLPRASSRMASGVAQPISLPDFMIASSLAMLSTSDTMWVDMMTSLLNPSSPSRLRKRRRSSGSR